MRPFPLALRKEFVIFKKLDTPVKVQDFLERMPVNFEKGGATCRSPREALRHKKIHCMEGAMLAAAALWYHGRPPLLLDLVTTNNDDDHVVVPFKEGGRWGALSKTNHAVLRYRDPVYRDLRELAMSYFHEYFLDDGEKTLRSYSTRPFDLSRLGKNDDWLTSKKNLWYVAEALNDALHTRIMSERAAGRLRKASPIERKAGKLVEQKR